MKTTGDGFLATFDSPTRAMSAPAPCATACAAWPAIDIGGTKLLPAGSTGMLTGPAVLFKLWLLPAS